MPESLSYKIPRSFGQVLGKLMRNPLQLISETATRFFDWTNRVDYSLSRHLEFLQLFLMVLSPICLQNKENVNTQATKKRDPQQK